MKRNKRVLFLGPFPKGIGPSQRFRFEQYLRFLEESDIDYRYEVFIDEKTWSVLYKPGNLLGKALGYIRALLKRFLLLFQLYPYEFIFVHREIAQIGPPIFEFIIAKVFRKKIIFDFDDAIWLPNFSEHNAKFQWLKAYGKIKHIIKWSYKIAAGNEYLLDYSKQFNQQVFLNPTTIDTEFLHNPALHNRENNRVPVIGWTGTLTTAKYLGQLIPVLEKLKQTHEFQFLVISNEEPKEALPNILYVPWRKETEIEDLMRIDIGVMPLPDDKWSKGKCGFKALQYMALGIPTLLSPVGVNKEIIEHNVSGLICEQQEDWYDSLKNLLDDEALRQRLGSSGRERVVEKYSVWSNKDNFLALFS